jgi:hypothetical protein
MRNKKEYVIIIHMTKYLARLPFGFLVWILPLVVYGQPVPPDVGLPMGGQASQADITLRIINYVLALLGVVALLSLFVGPVCGIILLVTARGRKKRIVWGIICIVAPVFLIILIGIVAALINFFFRGMTGGVPAGML